MRNNVQETIERMSQQFPWYAQMTRQERTNQVKAYMDLKSLPLITASILEAHYYTDNNPLAQCNHHNRYLTSGTSANKRKAIYYSTFDEEAYLRIKLEVFRRILGTSCYRTALADMGTGHAEATAVAVFRYLGIEVESISHRLPIEQHIVRLVHSRPEVLYTMPSILDRILLSSADPTIYGIRHVILVGEMASPAWIQRVAQRLCIGVEQITDTYGSIEIGTIAYFSHEHGRYICTEGLIAEGVGTEALGEDLEPLMAEDEQVLVLTSTVRDSFPALRYVTYDVVRDLRPIRVNGSLQQSFQCVVKRIGADLKHGEKISIYDIENIVYRYVSDAIVRVLVAGNALNINVYSPHISGSVLEHIRVEVENCIPAIGMMIRARILEGIQVIQGNFEDFFHNQDVVKNKKIWVESREE